MQQMKGTQGQPALLQAISSGALSQGVANLSEVASQMIGSPELRGLDDRQGQLQQIIALSQHQDDILALERETRAFSERSIADAPAIARKLIEKQS